MFFYFRVILPVLTEGRVKFMAFLLYFLLFFYFIKSEFLCFTIASFGNVFS